MENVINVLNFGGLGNRLNNIVNGIYFCQLYNRTLAISWPVNNACSCDFNDLFENNFHQINTSNISEPLNINSYLEHYGKQCLFMKNNWPEEVITSLYSKKFISYEKTGTGRRIKKIIGNTENNVLLQGYSLFDCISLHEARNILTNLKPISEIQEKINKFIKINNLGKNVIGIHMRRTDLNTSSDEIIIEKIERILIKNKSQVFFICSDSKNSEENLKERFPDNVILYEKKHYVEKKDSNESWNNKAGYNVYRSKESVKEGLIDLILLGQTNFKYKSPGTFSGIATVLSEKNNLIRKIRTFAS